MHKKICFIIFFIYSFGILNGTEPIHVGNRDFNGIYIGKHVKYLSEKELFQIISNDWQAEDIFKEKIKSGQLHSDKKIKVEIYNTGTGYKAKLKYQDKTGYIEWGIKDILKKEVLAEFKQSDKKILKLNFIPHSYWLMFSIDNSSDTSKELFLQLDKYLFNMFHLYTVNNNRISIKRMDFPVAIKDREIKDKKMTFPITALPGRNTYYLRIDNWFMDTVPIRLWSKYLFYQYIAMDNAILGIFAGIFILVFLYNIFIYFFIKDKSYIFLSLMTVCALISHLVVSGFGFQYFWPNNYMISIFLLYSYFPLMMIFTLLFSRSFIEIERLTPIINRYIFIMIIILCLFIPVIFLVPFTIQKILFAFIFILDHFYYFPLIISATIALRQKNRYGLFLLIAFTFYFISNVEWILSTFDIIPIQYINYLNIKGIAFIIIMILGLGYKFKIMRNLIADYKFKLDKAQNKLKNKVITDETKIKIEKVKEFLKENFREIISREGLASAVDMSPDHLGRIFKKDTGIKLSDYINNLRINDAEKQLKNKETKIIDIAFNVGFESLRNFNKVFYQIKGVTPSEYRKKLIK